MNADVHGTTCAVGFQFSGGGFDTRGIGGEVCGARDGGDGAAGPRRSVWGAAILSSGEENFSARTYWSGSDVGDGVGGWGRGGRGGGAGGGGGGGWSGGGGGGGGVCGKKRWAKKPRG